MNEGTGSTQQNESLAAVFERPGSPLQLRRFPTPNPMAGEAVVDIQLCTICGSDLHTVEGKRAEATPSILGHEILGIVRQVGHPAPTTIEGRHVQPGDRVTWSTCVSCQTCPRCISGLPQKCVNVAKYGHDRAVGRQALSGGMAERILLRAGSSIIRLDDALPDAVACPANCATATIAAAFRTAGRCSDRRVLIFGAGMLGVTAAAFAKHRGAAEVTICDPDEKRLKQASRFGADRCVRVGDQSLTPDRLGTFDQIIECSGSFGAIEAALKLGDIGCKLVLVGSVMPSRPVDVDPQAIVRSWYSIHGVHNYAPCDLREAITFLTETHTRYPFASLVDRTFPLAQVNEAIEYSLSSRAIRVALHP